MTSSKRDNGSVIVIDGKRKKDGITLGARKSTGKPRTVMKLPSSSSSLQPLKLQIHQRRKVVESRRNVQGGSVFKKLEKNKDLQRKSHVGLRKSKPRAEQVKPKETKRISETRKRASGNNQQYSKVKTTQSKVSTVQKVQPPSNNVVIDLEKCLVDDLSKDQKEVFKYVKEGRSVFFTGSAGVGKSYLLRALVQELRSKYSVDEIAITASTGVAACNVGGVTLHSFAGIGLGRGDANSLVKKVKNSKHAAIRWRVCKVLIIDEISMLEGDLFDKLEHVARKVRKDERFFGGIQLVICGDFFQLPPVHKRNEEPPKYVFESKSWKNIESSTFILRQIFRQRNQQFIKMLNEIRVGKVSPETVQQLKSRIGKTFQGQQPTKLYPFKNSVESENNLHLNKLKSEAKVYEAVDTGDSMLLRSLRNCSALETLKLKKGAKVILLKNLSFLDGLVNGSSGVVVGFTETTDLNEESLPIVNFDRYPNKVISREKFTVQMGEMTANRSQIPLILGWACTIHKSQGMTLDRIETTLARLFEKHMGYVALSRATDLSGVSLQDVDMNTVRVDEKVARYYETIKEIQERRDRGEELTPAKKFFMNTSFT